MANLTAIPTVEGIEILNSELIEQVKEFVLIGSKDHNVQILEDRLNQEVLSYEQINEYVFYKASIESSYYDDEGVLTFSCMIPVDEDLENYTYAVGIITKDSKLVSLTRTPKIIPIRGIGGAFVVKVAIKGEAGDIVFKKSEYITVNEADELFLKPLVANTNMNLTLVNKLIDKEVIRVD